MNPWIPASLGLSDSKLLLIACLLAAGYALRSGIVLVLGKCLRFRGLLPENVQIKRFFFPSLHITAFSLVLGVGLPLFNFPERTEAFLGRIDQITFALGISWFFVRVAKLIEQILYAVYARSGMDELRQRRMRTQIQYIYRIVALLLGIVGIGAILLSFEGARRFGASLIASAGVATAAVGFAAQKSLANLIAGFQIAFTQPFRIGDTLVVEKEFGTVEEITLTYVVLRLWDLRRLVLPITYFVEKPFENWTRTTTEIVATVFFYVDFATPIEPVREEFARQVRGSALWSGQGCSLVVTGTSVNGLELRGTFGARNASDAFDLRCAIREGMSRWLSTQLPQSLPRNRNVTQPVG
jgi:small-conductance mechanosensitive channel